MLRSALGGLVGVVFFCVAAARAGAQCQPHWSEQFPSPDLDGPVYASVVWDDGTGAALYVGGTFAHAGGLAVNGLAKWDGVKWSAVGPLLTAKPGSSYLAGVDALAVHDDGSGPALFVGGQFTKAGDLDVAHLVKWDGHAWSAVPGIVGYGASGSDFPYGTVTALASFDDGGGPALFVGLRTQIDGMTSTRMLARWKSGAWSGLGNTVYLAMSAVYSLAVFDDGSGSALYIAGKGRNSDRNVLRWKDGLISTLGGNAGINGTVWCMRPFNDGSGPALYFGGQFNGATQPSSVASLEAYNIVRWTAAGWSTVGPVRSINGDASSTSPDFGKGVLSMHGYEVAGNKRLVIGGNFVSFPTAPSFANLVAWNGSVFETLGSGFSFGVTATMATYAEAAGPSLFVGTGVKQSIARVTNSPSRWDGAAWTPMTGVLRNGPDSVAFSAIAAARLNGVPEVLIPGTFSGLTEAANSEDRRLIGWDGSGWVASTGGEGLFGDFVWAIKSVVWRGVPSVFVGSLAEYGSISNPTGSSAIVQYDGVNWTVPGGGIKAPSPDPKTNVIVGAIEVFAGSIVVAGKFLDAGGTPATNIAMWDGVAWSALGDGITKNNVAGPTISAMKSVSTPAGEVLYVAGSFDHAGGMPVLNFAAWDGAEWFVPPTGGVTADSLNALEVFDDGSGPKLFGAGRFTDPGGVRGALARLDPTGWTLVAPDGTGAALVVFDDGDGAQLYLGGGFLTMNGDPRTAGLARWDGVVWTDVAGGLGPNVWPSANLPNVRAMIAGDLGDGPSLFVAGEFRTAGGVLSGNFAQWNPCRQRCFGDYNGDSLVNGTDFDEFESAFLAGTDAADVDGNGFVNGDDADSFALAYFSGC